MKIEFEPIGLIHSPFKGLQGMPVQPAGAAGVKGTIVINNEYREGLKDLEGFSHIILLYFFHRCREFSLQVVPFMDTRPRGLFATRAPKRPNPIGISVVLLEKITDAVLYIRNVDILDCTPLLDIKPYVPEFDIPSNDGFRVGWLEHVKKDVEFKRSDGRFK